MSQICDTHFFNASDAIRIHDDLAIPTTIAQRVHLRRVEWRVYRVRSLYWDSLDHEVCYKEHDVA